MSDFFSGFRLSGCQRAFLVVVGGADFRRDVDFLPVSQFLARARVAAVARAALYHEFLHHPVEQCPVVLPLPGQADEIVPVSGRVVVQFEFHAARGGLDDNHTFLLLGRQWRRGKGRQHDKR